MNKKKKDKIVDMSRGAEWKAIRERLLPSESKKDA